MASADRLVVKVTDGATQHIKLRYTKDILPIERAEGAKSDWIDLRCATEVYMWPGDYYLIPLGVAMQLPEGYEAHIIPRSSTFEKYRILMANSYGLIDNAYAGDRDEWKFPAYATARVHIPKNERICQFRIVKTQPKIEFEVVEHLEKPNRNGIGSTGRI